MNIELSKKVKVRSTLALLGFIVISNIVSRLIQSHTTQVAGDRCIYDTWRWTTMSITDYMTTHDTANHIFTAVDSFMIDCFIVFFQGMFIVCGSIPTMYVLLLFYVTNSFCVNNSGQWPRPTPYLFKDPGFPSLFIPYDATNDLYFSGHVGMTTMFTMLSFNLGFTKLAYIGSFVVFYTFFMMLVLGGHYTNDMIIGFIVAITWSKFIFFRKYNYTHKILIGHCKVFSTFERLICCTRKNRELEIEDNLI